MSVNSSSNNFRLTHMKLLGRLAQCCVVLLDEVPPNFILREVIAGSISSSGIRWDRGGRVLLSASLVLILLCEAAIGCHLGRGGAETVRFCALSRILQELLFVGMNKSKMCCKSSRGFDISDRGRSKENIQVAESCHRMSNAFFSEGEDGVVRSRREKNRGEDQYNKIRRN